MGWWEVFLPFPVLQAIFWQGQAVLCFCLSFVSQELCYLSHNEFSSEELSFVGERALLGLLGGGGAEMLKNSVQLQELVDSLCTETIVRVQGVLSLLLEVLAASNMEISWCASLF